MFIRCRNSLSGHEASIPVDLILTGAMSVWVPLEGAEPSATPADVTYYTAPPPQKSAKSDTNKEI